MSRWICRICKTAVSVLNDRCLMCGYVRDLEPTEPEFASELAAALDRLDKAAVAMARLEVDYAHTFGLPYDDPKRVPPDRMSAARDEYHAACIAAIDIRKAQG